MSKLNRITRLGMLEDLRIHNEEVAATKHFLTNVVISPLAQIVLDYVFHISGKIDMRLVDIFESSKLPDMIINDHILTVEFDNSYKLSENAVCHDAHHGIGSHRIHRIWDIIMIHSNRDVRHFARSLAVQLNLPLDSPAIIMGIKNFCRNVIRGYVTLV